MSSSALFSDQEIQAVGGKSAPTSVTASPSSGNALFSDAEIAAAGQPQRSPEDDASDTRMSLVSGLTGMPTPNMTAEDRAQFAKGKAAGALSVPVVAGATIGATEAAPAAESILQISENALEHLAENYPQLAKLAGKLG